MDTSISSDELLLLPNKQELDIKTYKSYFYQMNLKTDNMTKIFSNDIEITYDDVVDLNRRITDKFSKYKEAGFLIDVNLKFQDKSNKSFNSWQNFEDFKLDRYEKPLRKIVLKWQMNIVFENNVLPQKHTLLVKLSDRLRPEEIINLIFSGGMDKIEDFETEVFPVIASVDFVDECLGEELIDLVGKWQKSLLSRTHKFNKVIKFAKNHKNMVSKVIDLFSQVICLFCIMSITFYNANKYKNITISNITILDVYNAGFWIVMAAIFFVIWKKVISLVSNAVYNNLNDYGEIHIFNITRGDISVLNEIKEQNNTNKLKVCTEVLFTFAVNFICGILSTICLHFFI